MIFCWLLIAIIRDPGAGMLKGLFFFNQNINPLDSNRIPRVGNSNGIPLFVNPAAAGGMNSCRSFGMVHDRERALCAVSKRRVRFCVIFQNGPRLKREFHQLDFFDPSRLRWILRH